MKEPLYTADIKNMTLAELERHAGRLGKEKYRAAQIMRWLYRRGARSFDEMTNLSRKFRDEMSRETRIGALRIDTILTSEDGTIKAGCALEDGLRIESVLIREKNHRTLCVSTQVGCGMGCTFCCTGASGYVRNLLPGEIADQITSLKFGIPEGSTVKNIVMMGMGEPLANYDNVLKAIEIITCEAGLGFSKRKITVSTCGIVPMIRRLSEDTTVNLAVSLNAADNETRDTLMPVNRAYPLEVLMDACRHYRMPRRRRITFEYVMIGGVNDRDADAKRLARLVAGVSCKFNLIPFNEFPGTPYTTPAEERIQSFRRILMHHHLTAVVRKSKGLDIMAACGQLTGREMSMKE